MPLLYTEDHTHYVDQVLEHCFIAGVGTLRSLLKQYFRIYVDCFVFSFLAKTERGFFNKIIKFNCNNYKVLTISCRHVIALRG